MIGIWEWSSILIELCCDCGFDSKWIFVDFVKQFLYPSQWSLNHFRTCVISVMRREGDTWMIIEGLYESNWSGCDNCLLKNWTKDDQSDCVGWSLVSHASWHIERGHGWRTFYRGSLWWLCSMNECQLRSIVWYRCKEMMTKMILIWVLSCELIWELSCEWPYEKD